MAEEPPDFPSKNQINKAGKYLRDVMNGTIPVEDFDKERWVHSIQIVTRFREAHGYPMTKVRNGLASMINTEGIDAALSQRHKRVPRIVRKLVRMGDTSLARLEDIGGCRVVVQTPADMDALCRRIRKNWSTAFMRDMRDYIANPKDIGYRARHFVVRRDERAIEIQVRTTGQQRWADAVETIDARRNLQLKDGVGPESLLENFAIAGEFIYRREWGLEIEPELGERLIASNDRVIAEGYYSR